MPETAVREEFDVFRATTTGCVKVSAKIFLLPHMGTHLGDKSIEQHVGEL